MKIGTIVKTNQKWQVVIPKKIREEIGMTKNALLNVIARGKGIYIYPITDVVGDFDSEDGYLEVLARTKGQWDGPNWDNIRRKRRNIELLASKKRKQKW